MGPESRVGEGFQEQQAAFVRRVQDQGDEGGHGGPGPDVALRVAERHGILQGAPGLIGDPLECGEEQVVAAGEALVEVAVRQARLLQTDRTVTAAHPSSCGQALGDVQEDLSAGGATIGELGPAPAPFRQLRCLHFPLSN